MNEYPYHNTPSDKFATLEYMLRCKRDIIAEEAPESPAKTETLSQLDSAIIRANTRFHLAVEAGR